MVDSVKYFAYFAVLGLVFVKTAESGGIPVLLWESSESTKTLAAPALSYLTTDDFATRLIKKVHTHRPTILVFAEETLSLEDFSWKDETQKGAFPSLKNISESSKIEFIPSVQNPLAALNDLVQSQNYIFRKYDQSSASAKPGTIIEVTLPEPTVSEDRPQLLRRHDALISQIYSSLVSSSTHLIVLFTGRQNSWVEAEHNRIRRQATDNSTDEMEEKNEVQYRGKDILMSTDQPPVLQIKGEKTVLSGKPTFQSDNRANYSRIIVLYTIGSEKVTLRFRFPFELDQWKLTDVEVVNGTNTIVLTPVTPMNWIPLGVSFKTSKDFVFENKAEQATLTFSGLQAQKFSKTITDSETFTSVHASTTTRQYFTAPIWMGIVVMFVLAIILSWGIAMLMDIKTMDRFDDPKGKTISVSANE